VRRWISYLVGLAGLVLVATLRIADPPAIEQLRLYTFDRYQLLKPRDYQPVPVRVVDIDDRSLERHGQWPWPRTLLARLVDRLSEQGAAVIALDIIFSEPDRSSPDAIAELWSDLPGFDDVKARLAGLPSHDSLFAEALARARVITGFVLTDQAGTPEPPVKAGFASAGDDPRLFLPDFHGSVVTLPELSAAVAGEGALNMVPEQDGIVRRVPLLMQRDDKMYPSLAAEILRVAQGASTYLVKASGASGEIGFGQKTGITHLRIGKLEVPTDADGQMRLRYTRRVAERIVPAWRVLEPGFDPAPIAGNLVLVGTSAAGLKDLRPTPLNPVEIGVLIHAQAIEQMLLGIHLVRPDWGPGAELLLLMLIGLILVLLLPRLGPALCAVLGGVAAAAAFGGSWLAFERVGLLLDPVYPAVGALAIYLAQSLVIYLQTERERGRIRNAFSRYLAPAMVERLSSDPSRLRLGGEMRPMTILFCDIRGFTTISETMNAEELTGFINRFLTPMTRIIMESGGTIDKYMGDAIMAFWNAPLDDPDHRQHAAAAALAMIAELERLNRDWRSTAEAEGRAFTPVSIGIGLNSGECCVGNLGSDQRFDYSVLGDSVNIASRLEGQSKTYGVAVVIGEETGVGLDGAVLLELDLIRVKGKTAPLRIYALLADSGDDPGDGPGDDAGPRRALFDSHAALLAAYRAQDWAAAESALERCRALGGSPLATLYALYGARIASFRSDPPGPDWDGVYEATTK